MEINIRKFKESDLAPMLEVMNEIVEDGGSFPFEDKFDEEGLMEFIRMEGYAACAVNENDEPLGMYLMCANQIGRMSTVANATYLVGKAFRGMHIGEALVRHSLKTAKEQGYRLMQFNGVVDSNTAARKLYKKVGFTELGVIPKGFRVKDGHFEDTHIMYYILADKL